MRASTILPCLFSLLWQAAVFTVSFTVHLLAVLNVRRSYPSGPIKLRRIDEVLDDASFR